ncbi:SseB family protein [Streptomyces capparidis]
MTDALNGGPATPAQQALRALAQNGADEQALSTLATSEVLLPDPGTPEAAPGEEAPGDDQGVMTLPVFEQEDGARLVPVFTSEDRLTQALPQIQRYHRVPLALLAGSWPSDELSLTIDVGAPEAVTLTAHGVRTLPSLGAR